MEMGPLHKSGTTGRDSERS